MDLLASSPVLTCVEAAAWEKRMLKGSAAEWAAMQDAGNKIATGILADFQEIGGLPVRARVLVLAGKGHNGGDALLAAGAILVQQPTAHALVLLCFGGEQLKPLARRALLALKKMAGQRVEITSASEALKPGSLANFAVCLDGIFGFQFHPPMTPAITRLLARVNAHPDIQLRAAVDLPSGVGTESAPVVFRADFTYATGIVKHPLISSANAAAVGRLRFLDLNFFPPHSAIAVPDRIVSGDLLAPFVRFRAARSDKRTFGHLLIVGGSRNYPGAVMMAARAALRSGVGLVTAFVPEKLAPAYAAQHPEVMWVGCPTNAEGALTVRAVALVRERSKRGSALLIGPGLGVEAATLQLVQKIVRETKLPLVLDADALRPEVLKLVLTKPFVGTPHAGELERIAPVVFRGKEFLARRGVLVVKGPLTKVTDGKTDYYSPYGGPVLARGGSGDLLAGLVGGLLAQQPEAPLRAAAQGMVWHGMAADLLARTHGQVAVETTQLLGQLGPALTSLHARHIDGKAGVHDFERPAQHRPDLA